MMFRGTANDGAVKLVNDFAHLAETLLGKVCHFAELPLGKVCHFAETLRQSVILRNYHYAKCVLLWKLLGKVCHFRWANILSFGEQDTVYAYTVIKSQVYS